jgi:hypothetical protein
MMVRAGTWLVPGLVFFSFFSGVWLARLGFHMRWSELAVVSVCMVIRRDRRQRRLALRRIWRCLVFDSPALIVAFLAAACSLPRGLSFVLSDLLPLLLSRLHSLLFACIFSLSVSLWYNQTQYNSCRRLVRLAVHDATQQVWTTNCHHNYDYNHNNNHVRLSPRTRLLYGTHAGEPLSLRHVLGALELAPPARQRPYLPGHGAAAVVCERRAGGVRGAVDGTRYLGAGRGPRPRPALVPHPRDGYRPVCAACGGRWDGCQSSRLEGRKGECEETTGMCGEHVLLHFQLAPCFRLRLLTCSISQWLGTWEVGRL